MRSKNEHKMLNLPELKNAIEKEFKVFAESVKEDRGWIEIKLLNGGGEKIEKITNFFQGANMVMKGKMKELHIGTDDRPRNVGTAFSQGQSYTEISFRLVNPTLALATIISKIKNEREKTISVYFDSKHPCPIDGTPDTLGCWG